MNKNSITKNYIYNLIYQILNIILPIITTPYISRVLGAENIGIYSYTLSISAYFILMGSLGISLYGQREIACFQKDKKKYSKTFFEIIILKTITMLISLTIFYITFIKGNNIYNYYYKILILEIIASMLDISFFLQGLEEFKKTVLRNILVKLFSVIAIFLFVKTSEDLKIYYFIYVTSLLIGNVLLWTYLPKLLVKVDFKNLKILKHIKPAISLLIPQIAIQVYTILDKTMIGSIISSKSEVGFYEQSQKIVKITLTIITSLGIVMMPRIANTYAQGEIQKVRDYMKKSFNAVFIMAFPIIFGLIAITNSFVPIFFGDGFDKTKILIKIISPIILLIGLSNVTGTQYLLPTKRQKEFTISVAIGAIVNFLLNSILIKRCGAVGASVATVIAEMSVTGMQIYFTRKDFNWIEILKLAKNYIIISLVMFVFCIVIGNILANNLISIVLQIIFGGIIYITGIYICKDKFVIDFINRRRGK